MDDELFILVVEKHSVLSCDIADISQPERDRTASSVDCGTEHFHCRTASEMDQVETVI